MSRTFLWFGLAFSALMVIVGLGSAKPLALLFWLLAGAGAAYKLFRKPSPEAS
ncbi:MAG TPA: hypothetical protein VEY09_01855 [Pyrinomonadaceae bacterium]|nr:hypothetical protein [Pyrinomonadaceae bacterium]